MEYRSALLPIAIGLLLSAMLASDGPAQPTAQYAFQQQVRAPNVTIK